MNEKSFEKTEEIDNRVKTIKETFGTAEHKVLRGHTFIDFVADNENEITQATYEVVKSIPSLMNEPDYRMLISDMYCFKLDRCFYQLKEEASIGYDMIYNQSISVSLKTKQNKDQFQRVNKRNNKKLIEPGEIVLKNKLSSGQNSIQAKDFFDYLFLISAHYEEKNGDYIIRFAVAPFGIVEQFISSFSRTDQIKVKIPNDAWSFLSDERRIHNPKITEIEERKNNIFRSGINNTYLDLEKVS